MIWLFPFVMILLQTGPPSATTAAAEDSKPIEVLLFSDFQCPFCAQFHKPIRELQAKGADGIPVKVTFKNFPLSIHSNAQIAHQAAMAAAEQGKFWEMHDLLFANQAAVKREDLLAYAKKLGLNVARFSKDLDSDRIKDRIKTDVAEGERLGVSGTPTIFVNGKAFSGTRPFDQLKKLVLDDQRRTRVLAEITDFMMSQGPANAPVTLEFFADLESPVSGPAFGVLKELMQRYPTTVRLQFRNFPLAFHPQAPLAHEAAMIAAREGRFWELATYALEHQDSLREQDLIAYAGLIGLNGANFAEMLQQRRYAPRVDADIQRGFQKGIRGSPTILIGNKRIDGVPNLDTLINYVEAELKTQPVSLSQRP